MIIGQKIKLCHIAEADVDDFINRYNDVKARTPLNGSIMRSPGEMLEEFRKTRFSSDSNEKLIIHTLDGDMLGFVAHFSCGGQFSGREIGYQLFDQESYGKGYGSEAVSMLVDYLFLSFPIVRIQARIHAKNAPSERVITKCGFQKEGIIRHAMFIQGKYADVGLFSIIRDDWAG